MNVNEKQCISGLFTASAEKPVALAGVRVSSFAWRIIQLSYLLRHTVALWGNFFPTGVPQENSLRLCPT